MHTKYIVLNEENRSGAIAEAAGIIRSGGLAAFPTETVYGLGGDALSRTSSERIYAAKGRPSDNPLIVHICRTRALEYITRELPPEAMALADAFWPGPLTMILKKSAAVPDETTGGLDTVAVRMPDQETALALIRASGGYIAAPSANLSGHPSPTKAQHVADDLDGRIEMILDDGDVGIGIESTIIDLTDEIPTILRPGYITPQMLSDVIGEVRVDPALMTVSGDAKPKAPGMKYRHYAPRANLILVRGTPDAVSEKISRLLADCEADGTPAGVICSDETEKCYRAGLCISLGSRADGEAVAHNLFAALRAFDESNVEIIYSEWFDVPQTGEAVLNRLRKAAGYQIIDASDTADATGERCDASL